MAGDCFAPIDICGSQFNRLDCDGSILTGPSDVVVACGVVDLKVTPTVIAADKKVARNGGGGICAQRTTPARLDGFAVTLTLCPTIDVELMELLSVWDLILDTADVTGGQLGDSVGIKDGSLSNPCNCNTEPCFNPGVTMLVWSNATDSTGISSTKPYTITALTRVRFQVSPESLVNGNFNNIVLIGETEPNPLWIDPNSVGVTPRGPGDIYPELAGHTGAFAQWDTVQVPPGGCTCELCGYLGCVAPTITLLAPDNGPAAGGTVVTITGTGFLGATGVTFDGVAGTGFTINSSTQITVTSPAGAAGPADVVVEGLCDDSAVALFTYT